LQLLADNTDVDKDVDVVHRDPNNADTAEVQSLRNCLLEPLNVSP